MRPRMATDVLAGFVVAGAFGLAGCWGDEDRATKGLLGPVESDGGGGAPGDGGPAVSAGLPDCAEGATLRRGKTAWECVTAGVGASGPGGANGPSGPGGPAGANGAAGATGPEGVTGAQGAAGPQGPRGVSVGGGELPAGFLGLFMGDCPDGWHEVPGTVGRLLVGVPSGGTPGSVVGAQLEDGEDRAHGHAYSEVPGHAHAVTWPETWTEAGMMADDHAAAEYETVIPLLDIGNGGCSGYGWNDTLEDYEPRFNIDNNAAQHICQNRRLEHAAEAPHVHRLPTAQITTASAGIGAPATEAVSTGLPLAYLRVCASD